MARLRGCLPLMSFLVLFMSCVEGSHSLRCHRVFPLQLTAAAMPCQYICAYYNGYTLRYGVRGEDDGTPCHKHGNAGVCWNGQCLTRYGEEDEWSQHASAASKVPLRIRKRDVGSTTKGASVTKTVETNGDSGTSTKTVNVIKTVKSSTSSEGVKSAAAAGLEGSYITGFNTQQSTGTKNGISNVPSVDVDPFAIKTARSGSQAAATFFSRGIQSPHTSQTVKNGGVKITVRRGPNGQIVRTRTVKKFIITKGPTTTVRRIVIKHGHTGGGGNLIQNGRNMHGTKTVQVSFSRGSMGGTNGPILGGKTDVSRKTSQITTLRTTTSARQNPISSIVHKTIKQERISGGQTLGGESTATKTVSTVAVTKSVRPTGSVVQVTKQAVTPLATASSAISKTATLRGLEVEVPGYAAGLRHNWKWVLARRVGVYPPYVQALDPDVLFYKLGLHKPNLPPLPGPVLDILNRVPVHPVGSDLYGYLLSSKILEKIRGFTDGVNGLTRLRNLLSTKNISNGDDSNFVNSLLTGTESSTPGSTLLRKLLLASLSRTGGNPLKSQYGSLFDGAYAGPFGSPWPAFSAGQFSEGSWPFYSRGPLGLSRPFGSYDSLSSARTSTDQQYPFSEDAGLLPSAETPSLENAESLLSDSGYIKSILTPTTKNRDGKEIRLGQSHENLEPVSEKLAQALGEEKLRLLLKIPIEQNSPLRRILKRLYRRGNHNVPNSHRGLGVGPNTRLYKRILRQILLERKHRDIFSPSKYTRSYGERMDNTHDLLSKLRDIDGKNNYDIIRYLATLTSSEPQRQESFEFTRDGSEGSNFKLRTLVDLLEKKHHPRQAGHQGSLERSHTKEMIDAILGYPRTHPSSDREAELSKQIRKALLTSHEGAMSTEGPGDAHLSKLISVQGTSHTQKMPQGLTQSQVLSTTYHSSKGAATAPIPISPAMASSPEVTRQITQAPQQGALLGINNIYTSATSPSSLRPYPQYVAQPFYFTGGNSGSDQAAMLSRQVLASTGGVYGNPLGQPATSMVNGAGGYSGYATVPINAAYLSQYGTQPYYFGTSLYGNHPHYVVEGHEAPGTRWQLRVWRHSPGVSSVASGFNSFASSHLGSVVTRARETVTRGLQLGSQPGRFGFTTFAPSVTGGSAFGATSQYVVRTPDGSIALSRQPLTYGSATQGSPASSVVVSQIKETTKTTSGTSLPTLSGGLSSNSFQSSVEGATSDGTRKSESLSDLTQGKVTNLLNDMNSDSGSENKGSSFSSDGATASSLQNDSDLSQSKLRR